MDYLNPYLFWAYRCGILVKSQSLLGAETYVRKKDPYG